MKAQEKMILQKKWHHFVVIFTTANKKMDSHNFAIHTSTRYIYMPQLAFHLRKNKNPLDSKWKNLKNIDKVI